MPGGDGTGRPTGPNRRAGRKKGNRPGAGPGGECKCPDCGETMPHRQGVPCYNMECPKCGSRMVRT